MPGFTHAVKAPCIAGMSLWDPVTCTLSDTSYVFKPNTDTPLEPEAEYYDDRDDTPMATDMTQCGPILVTRGRIKRYNVSLRRCMINWDLEVALKGDEASLMVDATGNTLGYQDVIATDTSTCSPAAQKPAGFWWVAYPVGRCGSSGYCATDAGSCVIEVFPYVTEPRVTVRTRTRENAEIGAEFTGWAYGITQDLIDGLPANLAALFPAPILPGAAHLEAAIDCALLPAPLCDTVPTTSLFT